MPNILNDFVGYIGGEYTFATTQDGEFGKELVGYTTSEFSFVPDWRVDEDPRKVAGYVKCQSERYADRNNDEYDADIDVRYSTGKGDAVNFGNAYRSTDVEKTYSPNPGYDIIGSSQVRCWYCNESVDLHDMRMWSRYSANDDAELALKQAFVTEMLVHYSEHRSNSDLPWVRTYIKVGVRRPDGSVVVIPENARRITKPWQVKGGLI